MITIAITKEILILFALSIAFLSFTVSLSYILEMFKKYETAKSLDRAGRVIFLGSLLSIIIMLIEQGAWSKKWETRNIIN